MKKKQGNVNIRVSAKARAKLKIRAAKMGISIIRLVDNLAG